MYRVCGILLYSVCGCRHPHQEVDPEREGRSAADGGAAAAAHSRAGPRHPPNIQVHPTLPGRAEVPRPPTGSVHAARWVFEYGMTSYTLIE